MASVEPQNEGMQRSGTTMSTPAKSPKVQSVGLNMKKDYNTLIQQEQSDDMRRVLQATVGRTATGKKQVTKENLLMYIREEIQHHDDCFYFPVVIAFFVLFAVTVMLHEDITNVAQVERNFRNMLEGTSFEGVAASSGHKFMDDIDVVADIYTYLNEALIPLFIPDLDSVNAEDATRVLRYNQLIGGLQLQQIRRKGVNCADRYPDLGPFKKDTTTNPLLATFICYPWDSYDDQCWGGVTGNASITHRDAFCPDGKDAAQAARRLVAAHGSKVGKGQSTSGALLGESHGTTYSLILHTHRGIKEARQRLDELWAEEWVDVATAWLGMKVFVLNPDLGVYTHAVVNVYFPPNGELIPEMTAQSFRAEPYQDKTVMAADICWVVLLFQLFAKCAISLLRAGANRECKEYWKNIWNWVNWGTVIVGVVIIILWVVFLGRLDNIKAIAMDVALERPPVPDNSTVLEEVRPSYQENAELLHTEMANLSAFLMVYRLILCWYTILIMSRFFQAFHAQPRLAVVTKTLSSSFVDLVHFGVVMTIVFMAYAVAGMFIFGHRLLQFSELSMAVNTCFLIMLGSFDFAELGAEHPITAGIWFWTYMLLIMLIMLNMLLAIIMDVYTEVKADAAITDPIWTQISRVISEFREQREWVSNRIIEEVVVSQKAERFDKDILVEVVPNMPPEQARELIDKAEEREAMQDNKGLSISDAMKMIGWIKIAVQKIARAIELIVIAEKEEKEMLLGGGGLAASLAGSGGGVLGGGMQGRSGGGVVTLDPVSDQRMAAVERRLSQMEEFMNEAMCYTVYRGKEMRNRLAVIEDLLRGQRDAMAMQADRDVWENPPSIAPAAGGGFGTGRGQSITFSA